MSFLILSASARFIAASCLRAGLEVVAVDLFGDWDLRQRCHGASQCYRADDFETMVRNVPWSGCQGVILGGGLENQIDLVTKIGKTLPILGISPIQLQRLRDPDLIARIVQSAGGRFPETWPDTDGSISNSLNANLFSAGAVPAEVTNLSTSRWLRKDLGGAGGGHVSRLNAEPDLRLRDSSEPENVSRNNQFVIQREIAGESVSAVFVNTINFSERSARCSLLGVTRQLVGESTFGAKPFAYTGSIGPLTIDSSLHTAIESLGHAIADEFQIPGVFGIDLMINAEGLWVIDVNPRITASAELFELGWEASQAIAQIHVSGCQGNLGCLPNTEKSTHGIDDTLFGKAIYFWPRLKPAVIDEATFARLIRLRWINAANQAPQQWIADIPNPETVISFGEPVCSVFVEGKSETEVHEKLVSFAGEVGRMIGTSVGTSVGTPISNL